MRTSGRVWRAVAAAIVAATATAAATAATSPAAAKEPAFDTVDPAYAISNHVVNIPPNAAEGGVGPLGVAMDPFGAHELYVGDSGGNVWKFPTTTGTPPFPGSDELLGFGPHYVGNAGTGLWAMTFDAAGHLYASSNPGIVELDKNDAHVLRTITPEIGGCFGLGIHNGELFAECGSIYRIGNLSGPGDAVVIANPAFESLGAAAPVYSDTTGDGITIADDGTIYVATGSGVREVQGPASATPGSWVDLTADVGGDQLTSFSGGSDGMAIGTSGGNRFLVINNTDGTIQRLDFGPAGANTVTTMASGGTRGDFATVGVDGCMYLTQSTTVAKLTKADGSCDFAPTVPTAQATITGDLDFGAVTVGTSATKSVTVTNTGTAALSFSEAARLEPVGNGFSVTGGTCSTGTALAPNESCTVAVTFEPSVPGDRAADLVLTDNAPGGTQTTHASGTGTALPGADIPEAPFATLLPVSLIAIAGGALLVRRRRGRGATDDAAE